MSIFTIKTAICRILFSFVFIIFLSASLYSEEVSSTVPSQEVDSEWAVTIYPFLTAYCALVGLQSSSLLVGLSAEVEYKLNSYISLPVEIRYVHWSVEKYSINVLDVGPGLRFYPQGNGMEGFFIGHYIQFLFGSLHGVEDSGNVNNSEYLGLPKKYISTTWFGYRWQFTDYHFEFSTGIVGYYPVYEKNGVKKSIVSSGLGLGFGKMF